MSHWLKYARCATLGDPELFFPVGTGPEADRQAEDARAECARCPVAAACLQDALEKGDGGIRGGTTEDERRQMRRRNPTPDQERVRGAAMARVEAKRSKTRSRRDQVTELLDGLEHLSTMATARFLIANHGGHDAIRGRGVSAVINDVRMIRQAEHAAADRETVAS